MPRRALLTAGLVVVWAGMMAAAYLAAPLLDRLVYGEAGILKLHLEDINQWEYRAGVLARWRAGYRPPSKRDPRHARFERYWQAMTEGRRRTIERRGITVGFRAKVNTYGEIMPKNETAQDREIMASIEPVPANGVIPVCRINPQAPRYTSKDTANGLVLTEQHPYIRRGVETVINPDYEDADHEILIFRDDKNHFFLGLGRVSK